MGDPRRSARSTKGVNSRLSDANIESPTPASARRRKSKAAPAEEEEEGHEQSVEESGDGEEKRDEIIRCVCGAKDEEDDGRMMILCEGCDAWQHTQCMGIPKKKIPKQYFCEICKPELHKTLLDQMAAGEKPWLKRPGGRKRKSEVPPTTPAKEKEPITAPPTAPTTGRKRGSKSKDSATRQESTPAPAPAATPTPTEAPAPQTPAAVSAPASTKSPEKVNLPVQTTEKVKPPTQKAEEHAPPTPSAPPAPPAEPDKMDIDTPSTVKRNGPTVRERRASAHAVQMPPPVEVRNGRTLPPIDTQSPVTKPRSKREAQTPKSAKRKATDSDGEYNADEVKEPEKKVRRVSVATPTESSTKATPDRRRSSTSAPKAAPPKKQKTEDTTPQRELVSDVSELRNSKRRGVVQYLIDNVMESAKRLLAEGDIALEPSTTLEKLCERFALQIEHHVYLNCFKGGEIVSEYQKRCRSIGYNLKSNPSLGDELLSERLSCERLSHMTTEEMASKELKELTQQVRLESEKQNTLINETGPRIRRTHKGEELIDEGDSSMNGQDTLLDTGTVVRQSAEVYEETPGSTTPVIVESPATQHDASMSPPALDAVETPRSPSRPPTIDTSAPPAEKARSFSIENVWSHVESPDAPRPPRPSVPTPTSAKPVPQSQVDRDIDMLLKDDDAGTPPYSPKSFDDHYSPKVEVEDGTAWKGRIAMNQIATLNGIATHLGGPETIGDKKWFELMDPVLNIEGRIKHERAIEYLCGQKFARSSQLLMALLKPADSRSHQDFDKLFDYFTERVRYAVVGQQSNPAIKDLYVVPIGPNDSLPDWFNVVDPPSNVPETGRTGRMLVLIFVVIRGYVAGAANMPLQQVQGSAFGTPQQPQASPYPPGQPATGAAAQGANYAPASSPSQSPAQFGFSQHPLSRQQPTSQSPVQSTQTTYSQSQPQQPSSHITPPQETSTPAASSFSPAHPMTRELVKMVPGLGEMQIRAIDALLYENPSLQTDPEALAKEVEKVLQNQQQQESPPPQQK